MYITPPQQSILDLLQDFHCLRKDQITKIINKKHKIKSKPVKSVHLMLNQLKMLGKVYVDGQFISVSGFKKSEGFSDMITAVDIAVALTKGDMAEIHTDGDAVALRFSFDVPGENGEPVKTHRFAVFVIHSYSEEIEKSVKKLSDLGTGMIFLLDNLEQSKMFKSIYGIPKIYFAVRDGEWKFKFYKNFKNESAE